MRIIYIAHRAQQYDPRLGATNPHWRATIVRESRGQIGTLLGLLTLACVVALARGVPAAHSAAGRVALSVVFGGVLVVLIAGWIVALRRPRRLEITEDAVRYVQRNGQVSALSRQQGDELRWVKELRGRTWRLGLTIAGTDTVILLGTFSRKAVRQACLARGWRFDDQAVVRR
jgi:hypothetical protein